MEEIYEMSKLTRLKLLHNEIHELPDDIGRLQSLINLNLCDNMLTLLPGICMPKWISKRA